MSTRPIRLGLFAGSPVHYQVPLYRLLAEDPRVEFTAVFASSSGATRGYTEGYGREIDWGVDVLSGYRSVFLKSADTRPTGGNALALRDPDVVRVVLSSRFDVLWLHGYHTVAHVLAALAQRARGGRVMYREDQTLLNRRPGWKTAVKSVGLRLLFSGAEGLYVGTENRLWFERWGVSPDRLHHAPYAVDNDALRRAASDLAPQREALQRSFGIADGAGPVILFLGRLIPKKRPLVLLEAFARVRAQANCALLFVGSGPLEAQLAAAVERDGIQDVSFAGFLPQHEVPRAYAASDIFALPSAINETWGLVVNEAMNFALPVVTTDRVGSATDLVRDGENGFVVPPDDVDALAAALGRLVEDEGVRRAFGARSRERVGEWTYRRTEDAIVEAAHAAVGRKSATVSDLAEVTE
jgi:glycosyltransferase involved in cell wall biosynthesis